MLTSYSSTLLLLLLPSLNLAAPSQQLTFSSSSSDSVKSGIPALSPLNFPKHTLIDLNDGSFVPSPAFGVGSSWFRQNVTEAVLMALENGYRHIDCAAIYGNEESVGDALRIANIPREQLYITSKYDHIDGRNVTVELHESLRKLGLTYLDQYLIHFPSIVPDPSLVWPSFELLVSQSLVRTIGISNYSPQDLSLLLQSAKIIPAINQIRLHPYNFAEQKSVVKKGKKVGMVTAAYSALTSLTKEPGGEVDGVVQRIAEKRNITVAQVLLAWVKQKDILVVTTSGNPGRQIEQLEVFGHEFPTLSKKDRKAIEKAGGK